MIFPEGNIDNAIGKSKQIKVNDKIVAVAQGDNDFADVVDEKLDKVVQQIRGQKNTKVRLNIIPADGSTSFFRPMSRSVTRFINHRKTMPGFCSRRTKTGSS